MNFVILSLVLLLTVITLLLMFFQMLKEKPICIRFAVKLKLIICGFVAFISDALGIGSFAVEVALCKFWKLADDKDLPGILNGAQILPGTIEAIFFLKLVSVDVKTLSILVGGACIGGVLGGLFVSKLKQQTIRITMFFAFIGIAALILVNQFHLLPVGGTETLLISWKLWVGFFAMIICGALPAVGVGSFALIQSALFLLGLSPLVAFPIMTTAGALQQPLTAMTFLFEKKMLLKKTFIITIAGTLAVLITVPLVSHVPLVYLRWLLLCIVTYNAVSMLKSYLKEKAGGC
jgi:uncharacterized membrane protein YfcA